MGNYTTAIDSKYYGFRIYKILENGPISKVGSIKELEDFIIPPEGFDKKLEFSKFLAKNNGKTINLSIYSIRTRSIRTIDLTPDDKWTEDKSKGFLGANVRYENWAMAHKNVLRFIDIKSNSLIDQAGIVKNEDFLIAMKRLDSDIISLNQDEKNPLELFEELLNACMDTEVEFIIYNKLKGYKSIHLTLIQQKNGDLLGCDLAYGQLHEFPQEVLQLDNKKDKEIDSLINN